MSVLSLLSSSTAQGRFVFWQRGALGISVESTGVRIVHLVRGRISWAVEVPVEPGEPDLAGALSAALREIPGGTRRVARCRAVIGLGAEHARIRRLDGLPAINEMGTLSALVRESPRRWFVLDGAIPTTGEVCRLADGSPWSFAFDARLGQALAAECEKVGISPYAIVHAGTVLDLAIEETGFVWRDGPGAIDVRMEGGELHSVAQFAEPAAEATNLSFRAPAAALGDAATRFAVAVGASLAAARVARLRSPFRFRTATNAAVPRWRARLAQVALAFSTLLALGAFPLSSFVSRAASQRQLSKLSTVAGPAIAAEVQLAAVTDSLSAIDRRRAESRSSVILLSRLAQSLPQGAAIVAVRIDTTQGVVVVLGPRAGTMADRIAEIPGVIAPELVGPILSEVANGATRERATIRFGWGRDAVSTTDRVP